MTRLHLAMVAAAVVGVVSGTLASLKVTPYVVALTESQNGRQENTTRSNDVSSATGMASEADAASFASELVSFSKKLNASLPIMVDRETRLDATIPGPGNQLTYVYTLVNHAKKDLNIPKLRQYVRSRSIATYKTDKNMRDFRNYNVALHYRYKDRRGESLFDLTITPKDF